MLNIDNKTKNTSIEIITRPQEEDNCIENQIKGVLFDMGLPESWLNKSFCTDQEKTTQKPSHTTASLFQILLQPQEALDKCSLLVSAPYTLGPKVAWLIGRNDTEKDPHILQDFIKNGSILSPQSNKKDPEFIKICGKNGDEYLSTIGEKRIVVKNIDACFPHVSTESLPKIILGLLHGENIQLENLSISL